MSSVLLLITYVPVCLRYVTHLMKRIQRGTTMFQRSVHSFNSETCCWFNQIKHLL